MQPKGSLVLTAADGHKERYELEQGALTLGRAAENHVILDDPKISRRHARLEWSDGGWEVIDLGSSNGTFVNGEPVQRRRIQLGDTVMIGDSTLRLREDEAAETAALAQTVDIQSEADLERTLADATVAVRLNEVDVPRLAVRIPNRPTWEIALHETLSIGRSNDNDVIVDLPQVSRAHARIERQGDGFVLRDLKSSNGTWLGSTRIEDVALAGGETIQIGAAQLVFKHSATPDNLTVVEGVSHGGKRQPVIVVPGIMGSQLWLGEERVWPNVRRLFTQPDLLKLPDEHPIEARGIVREVVVVPNLIKQEQYSRLSDYLVESLGYERDKDLIEFAYDWRQDLRESAKRLAQTIDAWDVEPPITIIAHSMGSLVSRYYVERLGGRHKVGRLIVIGGPHAGAPSSLVQLSTGVQVLPFGLMGDRLRQVISTFPSAYCLLPVNMCVTDQDGRSISVLEDETWLDEEHVPLLRNARAFRKELGTQSSVPTVSIFGYDMDTLSRIEVERDLDGRWTNVKEIRESGDDTVPEGSAVLQNTEIHPVKQHHGALYVDNDVKMRLKLELTK